MRIILATIGMAGSIRWNSDSHECRIVSQGVV